jgi:hypothetical protein
MKDYDDGRVQVQDKRDERTDVLRPVDGKRTEYPSQMCKNHQCTAEDDMGFGLQDDTRKIRMRTMKNTILTIGMVLLLVVGVTAGIAMAYPEEPPMGVTITDINGIPLHQTGQVGQFGIFEVMGGK